MESMTNFSERDEHGILILDANGNFTPYQLLKSWRPELLTRLTINEDGTVH